MRSQNQKIYFEINNTGCWNTPTNHPGVSIVSTEEVFARKIGPFKYEDSIKTTLKKHMGICITEQSQRYFRKLIDHIYDLLYVFLINFGQLKETEKPYVTYYMCLYKVPVSKRERLPKRVVTQPLESSVTLI